MYSKLPMFVLEIRFGYNEKCCLILTANVELVQCLQKTRIHKSHVFGRKRKDKNLNKLGL